MMEWKSFAQLCGAAVIGFIFIGFIIFSQGVNRTPVTVCIKGHEIFVPSSLSPAYDKTVQICDEYHTDVKEKK